MLAVYASFARVQNFYPVFSNGLFKADKEESARGRRVALQKRHFDCFLTNP